METHGDQYLVYKDMLRPDAKYYIYLFIYLFIYLKIRTMYRGENNRTRSPLLGSPSYMNPVRRSANPRMHSRNLFSVPRKTHPCY